MRDLQETIDDAVDLGAEVVHVEASDISSGVESVARSRRATHVVLPLQESSAVQRLRQRTLPEQLIERLPDLEVHVVGPKPADRGGR